MKKALSLILSLLMIITALPLTSISSFAQTNNANDVIEPQYFESIRYPEDTAVFLDNSNQPISFYSVPGASYNFYNNLSADAKIIYNAVVAQKAGLETNGNVTEIDVSGMSNYNIAIQAALSAIIDDYPEFFWIGGYGYSGYLNNMTISFSLNTSDYADWDVVKNCYNDLMDAVDGFVVDGSTRYEKVKSIHDQICSMISYDFTFRVPMTHEPTGALLNGVAVCEGYAEATKLLCDREGIPCIIVVGTGDGEAHEWNYIKMDDNLWYGYDATWDDQEENGIFYDYFLVGSETENVYFGGGKFGDGSNNKTTGGDHVNGGTHFQNALYALSYPALAKTRYELTNSPKLLDISNTAGGVKITWSSYKDCTSYNLYRKVKGETEWTQITSTISTNYTDINVENNKEYYYTVSGVSDTEGESKYGENVINILRLPAPTVSVANNAGGVKVSWKTITGATKYNIYRKTGSGSYSKIGTTTELSYVDSTAKSGTSYTYAASAVNGTSESYYSGKTILRLSAPSIKVANNADGVKVSWSAITGAKSYDVYRKTGSGSYTKLGNTTSTSYVDKTAKSGTSYTYMAKAVNGVTVSGYSGKTILRLSAPSIKVANNTAGVKVSWSKITGAKSYAVYRKTSSGVYSKIGTTTSTSYVDKTAKSGTKYTYMVKAVNGSTVSGYSGKTLLRLSAPVITLSNTKSGPKAAWSKVTGAKSYDVYRKTGSGSYSKIGTTTSTSYVDKKAKSGTKYTYMVKAVNSSYVSGYSGKTITCKK